MWRALALALALVFASAHAAEVRIKDYKFVPERITVRAGESVKWMNDEKRASHSVWFKNEGLPDSDRMLPGDSWERRFDKPGTFRYTCGPHPEMNGVVEVNMGPE